MRRRALGTPGGLANTPRHPEHRGVDRVGWMFVFTAAAYNLIRMRNLEAAT